MAISTTGERLDTEALNDRTKSAGGFSAVVFASSPLEDNGVFDSPDTPGALSIPAFSSKPDAPATLYLDFNGHNETVAGNNRTGEFCNVEMSKCELFRGTSHEDFSKSDSIAVRVIKEIWQAVAEKCASFNVNVTTVKPGDLSDGRALRVAVGNLYQDCYMSMLQYR